MAYSATPAGVDLVEDAFPVDALSLSTGYFPSSFQDGKAKLTEELQVQFE